MIFILQITLSLLPARPLKDFSFFLRQALQSPTIDFVENFINVAFGNLGNIVREDFDGEKGGQLELTLLVADKEVGRSDIRCQKDQ